MTQSKFLKEISSWSVKNRVELARQLTEKLTYQILNTIQLNETNKLITYSDRLSSQIPASYAGFAYDNFQSSLHQFEIVRLCSFWDHADADAITVPTIIELIDDVAVIAYLTDDVRSKHTNQIQSASSTNGLEILPIEDSAFLRSEFDFGNEQSLKAYRGLRNVIASAKDHLRSELYKSVKNLRNKSLAHSLIKTRLEHKIEVKPMVYGDEQKLLLETVHIIQELYLWVNGSDFDITGDSTILARKRAKDLWENCKFDIPKQGDA